VRSKLQAAVARSFVAGFRWVMVLSALMAFASAAIAWVLISPKKRAGKAITPKKRSGKSIIPKKRRR
jgi:hypothetical protein